MKTLEKKAGRCAWSLFALLCFVRAGAQVPDLVEVDTITYAFKTRVPFDRPFVLKIRTDQRPTQVLYLTDKKLAFGTAMFRHWACTTNGPTCKAYSTAMDKLLAQQHQAGIAPPQVDALQNQIDALVQKAIDDNCVFFTSKLPDERVGFNKEGGKSYSYVYFGDRAYSGSCDPQRNDIIGPGLNLGVMLLYTDPVGYDIMQALYTGNNAKAVELHNAHVAEERRALGASFIGGDPVQDRAGLDLSLFDAVRAQLVSIDTAEHRVDRIGSGPHPVNPHYLLDSLIKQALFDTIPGSAHCLIDCDLTKALIDLRGLSPAAVADLVTGRRSLADATRANDPEKRVGFLKATIATLDRMLRYQTSRRALDGAAFDGNELGELRSACQQTLALLQGLVRNRNTVLEQAGTRYMRLSEIAGTTTIYDLKTRGAFRIIPDAGVVVYGFQKGFTRVSPYLGIEVNLRQVDKAIPFSRYPNKKLWHYTALTLGYTTMSLSEDGERTDLFDKGALMTGLGLRLNNTLRVTTGALWFYKDDPNPVIKERTLTSTFYAGLSIDLELRDLLNGFDKLSFKP